MIDANLRGTLRGNHPRRLQRPHRLLLSFDIRGVKNNGERVRLLLRSWDKERFGI